MENVTAPVPTRSKGFNIVLWLLQIGAALLFAMAAFFKLTGAEEMVALFADIGIGQWFRYLTGLLQATGAILILIPAFAAAGALLLAGTMLGAVLAHLFVIGGSPLGSLVLLAVTAFIAWVRRPQWVGRRPEWA